MTTGFRRTNRRRDGRYTPRRRVCQFCEGKTDSADYKDIPLLNRFINDRARMEPRRRTGTCARHQRMVSRAIKRARAVALMPMHSTHEKVYISQLSREQKVVNVPDKPPESDSVTPEVPSTVSDAQTVESPVVTEETAVASQEEEPAVDVPVAAKIEAEEAPSSLATSEETNVEEKPSES